MRNGSALPQEITTGADTGAGAGEQALRFGRPFWLGYGAAWLLYTAVMFAFYSMSQPLAVACWSCLYTTGSGALIGAWMVRRIEAQGLHPQVSAAFVVREGLFVVACASVWFAVVVTIDLATEAVRIGHWPMIDLDPWVLSRVVLFCLLAYLTLVAVCHGARAIEALRAVQLRAARLEALTARAQLDALRARLSPHFLFNTLHSLIALVRYDHAAAEDGLQRLSAMLRYVLSEPAADDGDVTLAAEVAFTRDYLALEGVRLGERLRVEIDLPRECERLAVPPLTLQLLAENAVRHGIAPRQRGGNLRLRLALEGQQVVATVVDDGDGTNVDPTELMRGNGLRLVRERLRAGFGEAARVDVNSAPGAGFSVTLAWPARVAQLRTAAPTGARTGALQGAP